MRCRRTIDRGGCRLALLALLTLACACRSSPPPKPVVAEVVSVTFSGESGAYRFEVGIRSPDTGCAQYADWWEVVTTDGRLVYRRPLAHSHIAEQPFVRAGGPVPVTPETELWVRAHMHPTGYGGQAFHGSVREGFQAKSLPAAFASGLAGEPPAPPPCAN